MGDNPACQSSDQGLRCNLLAYWEITNPPNEYDYAQNAFASSMFGANYSERQTPDMGLGTNQ